MVPVGLKMTDNRLVLVFGHQTLGDPLHHSDDSKFHSLFIFIFYFLF